MLNNEQIEEFISLLETGITQKDLMEYFSITIIELDMIIRKLLKNNISIQRLSDINGNIRYQIKNRTKYIVPVDEKTHQARMLIISDLHIGHIDANVLYMNKVYDYAKNNNIHIILILGDYIDGFKKKDKDKLLKLDSQIRNFVEYYPYDSHILNYFIGGNHEHNIYHKYHTDINDMISKERTDFINLGYGMGRVSIGKSTVALYHPLRYDDYSFDKSYTKKDVIRFQGHSHQYIVKYNTQDNRPIISVPCLSEVSVLYSNNNNGFLDVTFSLTKNNPDMLNIKYIDLSGTKIVSEYNIKLKNKTLKK